MPLSENGWHPMVSRIYPSGEINNPQLHAELRAASFKNIVDMAAKERDELIDQLSHRAVRLTTYFQFQLAIG